MHSYVHLFQSSISVKCIFKYAHWQLSVFVGKWDERRRVRAKAMVRTRMRRTVVQLKKSWKWIAFAWVCSRYFLNCHYLYNANAEEWFCVCSKFLCCQVERTSHTRILIKLSSCDLHHMQLWPYLHLSLSSLCCNCSWASVVGRVCVCLCAYMHHRLPTNKIQVCFFELIFHRTNNNNC